MKRESIWHKSVKMPEFPPLAADEKTDVAIIGGGVTGLLTAHFLREKGVRALILEADRLCSGQTGRTTAKITSQHDLIYADLLERLGESAAAQYARANEEAVAEYARIIDKGRIACDFVPCDAYLYSQTESAPLEQEADAARQLGIAADFTRESELPFPIAGAVRFRNQARFHPLKFLRAIAEDLNVREHTRVLSVEDDCIRTEGGAVTAEHIVFASHYPFINAPGFYFARMHQERSYVEYDSFTVNRPENRLLKSTLQYLYRHTGSSRNRNDLKSLLNSFAEVEPSGDYKGDFAKYVPDRNMKDYSTALRWCRVFLEGKSFTSFSGSEVALALLFPMETLFESYMAALLKKHLAPCGFAVSAQDRGCYLFDEPKRFAMRPDIVVRRKSDDAIFVLDTKWKLLGDSKLNYGISQADMYQMYAYQKKYAAACVTLLYPKTEGFASGERIEFTSKDGVTVKVSFVDLFDTAGCIKSLQAELQI